MKSHFATIVMVAGAGILGIPCDAALLYSKTHPIVAVINLLRELSQKVKDQGAAEELTFTKFQHWCTNSKSTLQRAIATEKASIDSLTDEIAGKGGQSKELATVIESLQTELGNYAASESESKSMRSKAAEAYTTADSDYAKTISAIETCIQSIESARPVGSFVVARREVHHILELVSLSASEQQMRDLVAFASNSAQQPEVLAKGDRDAHIKPYDSKTRTVVELLKSLKAKFEHERLAATKAETNALNAFSLSSEARAHAAQAAEAAKNEKTNEKNRVDGELATAQADLEETQNDFEADSTALSDTNKQCALKESEWVERSAVRKGELDAMSTGINILAKVSGVRTEAPVNPVMPASPLSFVQLGRAPGSAVQRAIELVRREAHEAHSQSFDRLAQQVAKLAQDPGAFDDVVNMIQKMIHRLTAEQTDEDKHKNWCDLELDKSHTSQLTKAEKKRELTLKTEVDLASVQLLTIEIGNNADFVAQLKAHMSDSTETRRIGKEENRLAIADAKSAQNALAEAVAVLEAFYKDSKMMKKEAWELLQQPVTLPEEPSTWGAAYTGVADPLEQPDGVVGLLKKIASSFSTMEADTKAQEASDQAAYDDERKACEIELARRTKESEMKAQEKKRLIDDIDSTSRLLKDVSANLDAVEQYIKDLQHACVEGDSTYEARKDARTKEIEALHEAQSILSQAFDAGTTGPDSRASGGPSFLAPERKI